MKKKLLAFTLSLVMIFGTFPVMHTLHAIPTTIINPDTGAYWSQTENGIISSGFVSDEKLEYVRNRIDFDKQRMSNIDSRVFECHPLLEETLTKPTSRAYITIINPYTGAFWEYLYTIYGYTLLSEGYIYNDELEYIRNSMGFVKSHSTSHSTTCCHLNCIPGSSIFYSVTHTFCFPWAGMPVPYYIPTRFGRIFDCFTTRETWWMSFFGPVWLRGITSSVRCRLRCNPNNPNQTKVTANYDGTLFLTEKF